MVSDPVMRRARQQSWLRQTYRRASRAYARVSSDGFDARLREDRCARTSRAYHRSSKMPYARAMVCVGGSHRASTLEQLEIQLSPYAELTLTVCPFERGKSLKLFREDRIVRRTFECNAINILNCRYSFRALKFFFFFRYFILIRGINFDRSLFL